MKRPPFLLAALADAPLKAEQKRHIEDGTDPRIVDIAGKLVRLVAVKEGEHVLIHACGAPDDLVVELIRAVRAAGGIPHPRIELPRIAAEVRAGATDGQFELEARLMMAETEAMDVIIAVDGEPTPPADRYVPPKNRELATKYFLPVCIRQLREKRRCQLFWPTAANARLSGIPQTELTDYYLDCSVMDLDSLRPAMEKLKAILEATDQVHIVGPGTDLTFSIKGIPATPCCGEINFPDGEVFTAPVRDSVNGTLSVNLPNKFQSHIFRDIRLRFENGRIVEVHCSDAESEALMQSNLDKAEDEHYLGEFGIGANPVMTRPIIDIIFDEKIAGSFHLAIGRCYEGSSNGNNGTTLHWDLVVMQSPEYGGGEIYFDGKLFRKDGRFLDPELAPLNPREPGRKKQTKP